VETEVYLKSLAYCERKLIWISIKLLKTEHNLLYIRNQSVPRCKHFPPRL